VLDVIATFGRRKQRECGRDERGDVIEGARSCSAEKRFQFRKRLFNGIEIGTVRRQKPERRADGLNGRADLRLPMDREVIEDDDIAGAQGGHEDLLDIGEKAAVVDGAIKHRRRRQALRPQRRDDRVGLPVAIGSVIVQSAAAQTAAIPAEQIRGDAAFVDEHPLAHVAQWHPRAPVAALSRDVGPALFVGVHRFF
jgi:hypothetical protein